MEYFNKNAENLTYTIPLFLIMGLIAGSITDLSGLKILIIPMTFLMVYPMMVNIDFKKFLEKDFSYRLRRSLLISGLYLIAFPGIIFSPIIPWLHSDFSLRFAYKRNDYFMDRFCKGECKLCCEDDNNRPVAGFPYTCLCKMANGCCNRYSC